MSLTLSRDNGEQLQLVTKDNEVIAITLTNARGDRIKINFDQYSSRRKMNKELFEGVAVSH